jgi:trans-aconitate 2-methyltransferase
LLQAFPQARVIGVDNSPEMLAKARKTLPALQFEEADLNHWQPEPGVDLLFSNATFQWLPDHLIILQKLLGGLRPGGELAVQMPDNLGEPSHVLMNEAAQNALYADKVRTAVAARAMLPSPSHYYEALKPLCSRLDIWHTVYNHPLKGVAGIVEWLMSTGLRPYLEPLSADQQKDYLARYETALAKAYPVQADGTVLLRFPRLFVVAVK